MKDEAKGAELNERKMTEESVMSLSYFVVVVVAVAVVVLAVVVVRGWVKENAIFLDGARTE